ncbi:vasotab-like [Lucilia sericata]|uniref:vasotab-like n=1 Tax=Lucilia sericata TaxID=13632 RepID=UPI0018A87033|nr:vasotab-like [Lucilia sericata]
MQFTTGFIILLLSLFSIVMADDYDDCPVVCPLIYAPVCGTIQNLDGESVKCTFPNDCMLGAFTCRAKQELVKKRGPCKEKFEGCNEIIRGF